MGIMAFNHRCYWGGKRLVLYSSEGFFVEVLILRNPDEVVVWLPFEFFLSCKAIFKICYGFSQDSIQGLDVFEFERQTLGDTPCCKWGDIARTTEDSGLHRSFSWFRSSEGVVNVFCKIVRRCWSLRFCRSFNLYKTEKPFSPFRICILLWSHICGFLGERTGGTFLTLRGHPDPFGWIWVSSICWQTWVSFPKPVPL